MDQQRRWVGKRCVLGLEDGKYQIAAEGSFKGCHCSRMASARDGKDSFQRYSATNSLSWQSKVITASWDGLIKLWVCYFFADYSISFTTVDMCTQDWALSAELVMPYQWAVSGVFVVALSSVKFFYVLSRPCVVFCVCAPWRSSFYARPWSIIDTLIINIFIRIIHANLTGQDKKGQELRKSVIRFSASSSDQFNLLYSNERIETPSKPYYFRQFRFRIQATLFPKEEMAKISTKSLQDSRFWVLSLFLGLRLVGSLINSLYLPMYSKKSLDNA